jgi:hypothetical protein
MTDDVAYGHDDDCCCCGPEATVEETASYETPADGESYDDAGYDAPSLPPVVEDGGIDLVEPDVPAYAEAFVTDAVETPDETRVDPAFIQLGDPEPAGAGAPAAHEYVSLAEPTAGAVGEAAFGGGEAVFGGGEAVFGGGDPAGSQPRWDQVPESEWSTMSPADQLAAFIGHPIATTSTGAPQIQIPGLVPTLADINDQIADQAATFLAPSGLTVTHENGSRVYEDSGGYKSSSLNDYQQDSSGRNHH